MLNRLKVMEILWKPVDCRFTLVEELYRLPCMLQYGVSGLKHWDQGLDLDSLKFRDLRLRLLEKLFALKWVLCTSMEYCRKFNDHHYFQDLDETFSIQSNFLDWDRDFCSLFSNSETGLKALRPILIPPKFKRGAFLKYDRNVWYFSL